MGVISYNSDEMEAVATSYKSSLEEAQYIKTHMEKAVQTIRDNWKGDDAEMAEADLKAIETQVASIESNIQEIVNLITKVMGDFGQLNYKGDGSNG